MNANKRESSLGRCVLAGLIAGALAALLANLANAVLERQFKQSYNELTWVSISRAAMISCVLGAFVYAGLLRWTKHARLWFVVLGLAVTILDSVLVVMYAPVPGIARVANPLHFVVAITALVLIPTLAPVIPPPTQKPSA